MAKLTISVELDTNDANDLVLGSKLSEVLDVLEAKPTKTAAPKAADEEDAPEEKPKRTRRTPAQIEADKKAAEASKGKKAAEEEEAPARRADKKKGGDDLEKIMEEGRAIMAKVIDKFRDDVKAEFKYYGVKTISDFTDREDLLEFIDFLKELEEELAPEEEEEEEAPRRRRR